MVDLTCVLHNRKLHDSYLSTNKGISLHLHFVLRCHSIFLIALHTHYNYNYDYSLQLFDFFFLLILLLLLLRLLLPSSVSSGLIPLTRLFRLRRIFFQFSKSNTLTHQGMLRCSSNLSKKNKHQTIKRVCIRKKWK